MTDPATPADPRNAERFNPAVAPLRQTEGDPYELAEHYMVRLESVLRASGLWPGDNPDGPVEVKGAFGCENMPCEHWLAWVLIPRVRQIIAERGDFPDGSAVGAYAVRAFDGLPGAAEVIGLLSEFDDRINNLGK
jgi:uncharacterized protein YqcC (DUF446 family)